MKRAKAKPAEWKMQVVGDSIRNRATGEHRQVLPRHAKAKPSLPRAVRELLRDVMEWHRVWSIKNDAVGEDMSLHDIATRAEAIVSRARKAGRR